MNFEELKETYGLKLNAAQSRAVQETEGAVLLLAVPGSGKTTVLVARLGYMVIALGIDPASALTMTYTVAATKDMKDRFCSFFGEEWRERVEFRTINGVCAKIIQSYERLTGGTAFSLITDEKELSALIGAIYKDTAFDFPTESDIKNIRTQNNRLGMATCAFSNSSNSAWRMTMLSINANPRPLPPNDPSPIRAKLE